MTALTIWVTLELGINRLFSGKLIAFNFLALALFSACTNSRLPAVVISGTTTSTTAGGTASATPSNTYVITNVTIGGASSSSVGGTAAPSPTPTASGAAAAAPSTSVFFDTTKSTTPLTTICSVGAAGVASTLPCNCQFTWNEANSSSGTIVNIARKVQSPVTLVQPYVVTCAAPSVYGSEIVAGTQINVTVLPASGNTQTGLFTVNTYPYTVGSNAVSGSFQDAAGHVFSNILRYSCFQTLERGMTIQNKQNVNTNTNTGEVINSLYATQFCLNLAAGGGGVSDTCPDLPGTSFSSQVGYYNLYVRDSERGDINQFDSSNTFVCPLIKEALGNNETLGTLNQPWPLDQTFALSVGPATGYPVGVVANSTLSNGSATSVSTSCYPNPSASTVATGTIVSNSAIINSCLGFAAQVNSDGTCPAITDSSGLTRQTFRLRRYVALFPPTFDTNGNTLANQPQGLDTIYVLDRPVAGSPNPLKPYTMLGPKPCPYAYFDHAGVATVPNPITTPTFSYAATSNPNWQGKNVDGIEFPNLDLAPAAGGPSCSSMFPIYNDSLSAWTFTTVNLFNQLPATYPGSTARSNTQFLEALLNQEAYSHIYIRPSQPFLPHYEEDTDFQACAPQAVPIIDPPLHFARDAVSGNVAWCAEAYPTQNPNIQAIDPPVPNPVVPTPATSPLPLASAALGKVANYTSHVVIPKGSASAPCNATQISIPSINYVYPPNTITAFKGYASHPNTFAWPSPSPQAGCTTTCASETCDRTVESTGLAWPLFPLLAPAVDVEETIVTDKSYMCMVTYDAGGAKTNVSTPSDGCCSRATVFVPTNASNPVASPTAAHLEPDVTCRTPSY